MGSQAADRIRRVSVLIARHRDDYVTRLAQARSEGRLRELETELIRNLEASATQVLDQFDRTVESPPHTSVGELMLIAFYDELLSLSHDGSRVTLERVP